MTDLTHRLLFGLAKIFNREEYVKTLRLLGEFTNQKRRLQLQLKGGTLAHYCTVVALNEEHGVMVVSNIFPKSSQTSVIRPGKVVLTTTESGATMQLDSKILCPLLDGDNEYWMLTLPVKVNTRQEQESIAYKVSRGSL